MRRALAVICVLLVAAGLLSACSRSGTRNLDAQRPRGATRSSSPTTSTSRSTGASAATEASSAAGAPAGTATTCGAGRPHAPGQSQETISVAGVDRSYLLYVPKSYAGTAPVPIVFDFHGYGSNAGQQIVYGDFRPQAERDGFVIVALDGQGDGGGRHFSLFGASPTEADDVAVTNTLLDHLEEVLCIDARRVYAAGMSDGGAMSSILACRAADRFAAVGPVAVILYVPQCDAVTQPVAIAGFHGTSDPVVPFDGGRVNCCGGPTLPGSPASMANFAKHDGCTTPPKEERLSPMILRRRWQGCKNSTEVEFYIVEGGGHTWPGSAFDVGRLGTTTHEISASEVLWQFFRDHPKAAA